MMKTNWVGGLSWTSLMLGMSPFLTAQEPVQRTPTGLGMHWVDYDGDALDDLFVLGDEGHLLRNDGAGSFVDVTLEAGLGTIARPHFASWRDVDGDGDPELFVACRDGSTALFLNIGEGLFQEQEGAAGLASQGLVTALDWRDFDQDGRSDVLLSGSQGDRLYRNVGDVHFELVTLPELPVRSFDLAAPDAEPKDGEAAPEPGAAGHTTTTSSGRVSVANPGFDGDRRPSFSSSTVLTAPVGTFPAGPAASAIVACALAVEDVSTGQCLPANSTPTLGSLYPLGPEFNIEAGTGNVGVGTTSPDYRLHAESATFGDRAVFGNATGTSGTGVFGQGNSPSGAGMRANNSATSGDAVGIEAGTSSATGLAGKFTADTLTEGASFVEDRFSAVHRGQTGRYGQAAAFDFNPDLQEGVMIEYGGSESGGFYADGDVAAIWSPGDLDILRVYDEDSLSSPNPEPRMTVTSGGDIKQLASRNGLVKAAVHIDAFGTGASIARGFNLMGGFTTVTRLGTGIYEVDFGAPVDTRFYQGTLGPTIAGNQTNGMIEVGPRVANPNALFIDIVNASNVNVDLDFSIVIF